MNLSEEKLPTNFRKETEPLRIIPVSSVPDKKQKLLDQLREALQ